MQKPTCIVWLPISFRRHMLLRSGSHHNEYLKEGEQAQLVCIFQFSNILDIWSYFNVLKYQKTKTNDALPPGGGVKTMLHTKTYLHAANILWAGTWQYRRRPWSRPSRPRDCASKEYPRMFWYVCPIFLWLCRRIRTGRRFKMCERTPVVLDWNHPRPWTDIGEDRTIAALDKTTKPMQNVFFFLLLILFSNNSKDLTSPIGTIIATKRIQEQKRLPRVNLKRGHPLAVKRASPSQDCLETKPTAK